MTVFLIVGGAVVVLCVMGWLGFRYAKNFGKAGAERDQFQRKTEQARCANEIDEDVARMSDDDLDRELRNGR